MYQGSIYVSNNSAKPSRLECDALCDALTLGATPEAVWRCQGRHAKNGVMMRHDGRHTACDRVWR